MRDYRLKTFGKEHPWLRVSGEDEAHEKGNERVQTLPGGKEADTLKAATEISDSTAHANENAETTEISTTGQQKNATLKNAEMESQRMMIEAKDQESAVFLRWLKRREPYSLSQNAWVLPSSTFAA